MDEVWKDIEGFEGEFQISNAGRLKSFKALANGRILKNTNKNGWYLTHVLYHSGQKVNGKTSRIHRLVAKHFIPNPYNLPEVNHMDLNKQNNYVDNLEWVSRKQNSHHAVKNKPSITAGMIKYNQTVRPRVIHQFDLQGNLVGEYINGAEASMTTNVCHRNILQVANRTEYRPGLTRKTAGGFIWKFKEAS
jgi:hypothetical protein